MVSATVHITGEGKVTLAGDEKNFLLYSKIQRVSKQTFHVIVLYINCTTKKQRQDLRNNHFHSIFIIYKMEVND